MPESRFQVYFLRHGDAGDPERWEGDDAHRPLSPKGVRQVARMAAFLAEIRFAPDAILTSPKLRAVQTAERVAGPLARPVTIEDRLAGAFTVEALGTLLDTTEPSNGGYRVLLVGHDPDFSSVVSTLAGATGIRLPTCALARVDLEDRPAAGRGSLRWLIPPEALGDPR
jgi:phosphohistidine phosphatase